MGKGGGVRGEGKGEARGRGRGEGKGYQPSPYLNFLCPLPLYFLFNVCLHVFV